MILGFEGMPAKNTAASLMGYLLEFS